MPGGKPKGKGEIESVYFSGHDLREVFSRDNANRRRESGHTLRRFLTDKQDRQILSSFIQIRREYAITNNNDAVLVWAQQMIDEGKESELDSELAAMAKKIKIPKREEPWDDDLGK